MTTGLGHPGQTSITALSGTSRAFSSVHRMMSGGLVTLTAPTAQDLIWTTRSRWQMSDKEFGFQAGPRGMENDAALPLDGFTYDQEYRLQGHTVVLGSGASFSIDDSGPPAENPVQEVLWLAAWLGTQNSLITSEFGRPGIAQGLLNRLAGFQINETPEGVALQPTIPETEFLLESATVEVPRIGTVRIYDPSEASSRLPSWGGTRVPGGELFTAHKHVEDGAVIESYVLANESAVATIDPSYIEAGSDIASGLASLRIDWEQ